MSDINKILLTGRVGREVEFDEVGKSKTALAKTSIAVNQWKGEDRGEEPMWVYLNFWGNRAKVAEYLEVGMKITITGSLNINEYEGKWYTSIDVDDLILPDRKDSGESGSRSKKGGRGKSKGGGSTRGGRSQDSRGRGSSGRKKSRKTPF